MRGTDTRGSMPFAVIAVTILLLSVAAGAVAASYQRAGDNADRTGDDIDAIDHAVLGTTAYIDRGLGEIIFGISTDDTLGGLGERAKEFDRRMSKWFEFQFDGKPMISGSTRVEYRSHDIDLVSEPMGLSSPTEMDGYMPTYLRGTGTVSVHIESQSGKADRDLEICTDGSYALPLAAERGSLFQSMAGDGGISLSQMMTYQLTSLAQYRVISGYGATGTLGKGTTDIITPDDVKDAYGICMQALSAICFRDGDNVLTGKQHADVADILVADGGTVSIDLAAVYSQAMLSALDDILLRWMDYLYAYDVAEAVIDVIQPFRDSLRSLASFIRGEERVSGVPYLKKVMDTNGYSEEDYRFPGSGTTEVTVGGYTVSVINPASDLFSMSWLTHFKQRYDSGDYVQDFILDVLKGAAIRLAERNDLGVVTFAVDPYDTTGFLERLNQVYRQTVSGCWDAVESSVSDALSGSDRRDEFYCRLADEIHSHSGDLVHIGEFRDRLRSELSDAIKSDDRPEEERPDIDELMASPAVSRAVSSYKAAVISDLSLFEPLKDVDGGSESLMKKVLTMICSYGLKALDILYPVEEKARLMGDEILAMNGMNPYGGIIDLPGSGSFELVDDAGNRLTEKLSADVSADELSVIVTSIPEKCVHVTGFRDERDAAYSTTFSVTVVGDVEYRVEGSGSLAESMDGISSAISDSFMVDTVLEVTVASGWALDGIDYIPTSTVLSDLSKMLLKIFEPLIEPLRKVMETIREAMTAISECVMEALGFVSEHLIRLYNAIMGPLEDLRQMIEDSIDELISESVFDVLVNISQAHQDVTFQFFGCELTLTTDIGTLASKTKSLLSMTLAMPIAGLGIVAGIDVKYRGDLGQFDSDGLVITGSGSVKGDGWEVGATLDPLMKGGKYLITVDGKIGKNRISLVAPKLERYHNIGTSLSDIPGIGDALNNIPLPVLGVNVGLDAGFNIRYASAMQNGIIINEIESNPEGEDSDNEWFEIHNNTDKGVDLKGWYVSYINGAREHVMPLSGTLPPGGFLVVEPTFNIINVSGNRLRIFDDEGNQSDSVEVPGDSDNSPATWQRTFDGSTKWEFAENTMGGSQGNIAFTNFGKDEVVTVLERSIDKAFDKVPNITDIDTLVAYTQQLIRYILEGLIDLAAEQLIDASVFAQVDLKDATSTVATGMRVAFRTDGDLIRDCLRYVAGHLESILLGMSNPYRIDPLEMFTENIDLEVCFHTGVGFPQLLSKGMDGLPEMDLNVVFRANLSSLTRIVDMDTGRPEMEFGILARDCPPELIPSKLGPKRDMCNDLWMFKTTVTLA